MAERVSQSQRACNRPGCSAAARGKHDRSLIRAPGQQIMIDSELLVRRVCSGHIFLRIRAVVSSDRDIAIKKKFKMAAAAILNLLLVSILVT